MPDQPASSAAFDECDCRPGRECPHRFTTACVPVPVELLRKVADLITCEAHGAWCWDHEDKTWPCPMARLKQYVPEEV